MNIKIHSSELNQMMKTILQCIDSRDTANRANIEIGSIENSLYIHASNGTMVATTLTPMIGLDDETFCVDGQMFGRICSMCSGDIEISTDGKVCTIKGTGRTRIPIVNANIPRQPDVIGKQVSIAAESLTRCYNHVAHAVSADNSRVVLTGILTKNDGGKLTMTTLDGFQMSIESADCEGDDMSIVIPANFMNVVSKAIVPGEKVDLYTDGHRIVAHTDSVTLSCGLLTGEFPDTKRILPTEFKTECMVDIGELRNALKSGSVINSKQNLVKLEIGSNSIKVMNNSEEADFEANVSCDTHGNGLLIAFNQKYLMNTIGAIDGESAIMCFNSSVAPCVVKEKDGDGVRLVLPVRVMG